ncbi:MAG: hypothetical protein A2V70_14070 [Planctomycetes bacterium RBG_13_63_9]|nr:MAG: hypothetical protein A2V70_14070 [Planctomycetes bacterium RBG_13_63_9]
MQHRFAILVRCKHAHANHLVHTIDGQQHRLGRHLVRVSWADDHLTTADAPDQNGMAHRDTVLGRKTFDALRHQVPILQPNHEHASNPSLGCFHPRDS